MSKSNLTEYYAQRAAEYELVYQVPARLPNLRQLAECLATAFSGQSVLEVACGTGYWTQFIAQSALDIVALDFNTEVLDLARQKNYGSCPVTFLQGDAYALPDALSLIPVTAGFHGFWWSHVPIQRRAEFLAGFHRRLPAGAPVVMLENRYIPGSSTPITRRDEDGNTYQNRTLLNGTPFEVLKNFQSPSELQASLMDFANDLQITELDFYWMARYTVKASTQIDLPSD
jgi:demethylmenaquinone methyltransferase/2-methoxy-6-polyprenyl-1,4-benzoquinol methylase